MNAGAMATHEKAIIRWQKHAENLWALYHDQGYITNKDIQAEVGRVETSTSVKQFQIYGIEMPPKSTVARGKMLARAKRLNEYYEQSGKKILTLTEAANIFGVTNQSAGKLIQKMLIEELDIPPIKRTAAVELIKRPRLLSDEDEAIEARRWQVSETHGKPIKTTRLGGLLVTPARREGGKTWYQCL